MYTGKVAGSVVSTTKDSNLEGVPLLVVQKIEKGKETDCIVAADATKQAGIGDFVYLINSKEASSAFRQKLMPVDAAIIGFVDEYYEEDI